VVKKTPVALCDLASKEPNTIILDERTNSLDKKSIDELT